MLRHKPGAWWWPIRVVFGFFFLHVALSHRELDEKGSKGLQRFAAIWDLVRGIRARGKTVLLTTHLMEEAERLCDRVAIIEHGRIVDMDTPEGLVKRHCPERTVVLTTDDPASSWWDWARRRSAHSTVWRRRSTFAR